MINFMRRFFEWISGRGREIEERSSNSLWAEFMDTNFSDGVIVEYAPSRPYFYREVESTRERINNTQIKPGQVEFFTDNGNYLINRDLRLIKKHGKIFLLDTIYPIAEYSFAPEGVVIPKKPSLDEVLRKKELEGNK